MWPSRWRWERPAQPCGSFGPSNTPACGAQRSGSRWRKGPLSLLRGGQTSIPLVTPPPLTFWFLKNSPKQNSALKLLPLLPLLLPPLQTGTPGQSDGASILGAGSRLPRSQSLWPEKAGLRQAERTAWFAPARPAGLRAVC